MARRGPRLTRDQAALALALLVHTGLWLGVRAWGDHLEPASLPRTRALADDIELDLSDPASELSPAPAALRAVTADHGAAAQRTPGVERRRETTVSSPPSAVALGDVSPSDPAPEAEPPPSALADTPIDLGLSPDGWQRWVTRARPAASPANREPRTPLVHAPPASTTGGLQEGLEARDLELGIGPAGRVTSALYQAAHSDAAPVVGVARFNVTVTRSGAVEISLGSASDAGWRAVAERAAEELRRSPPRIPPPRDGYRLTLKITAEEVMPNGIRRKDLHGPRIEGDPPRFRSLKEEQKELALKNPTLGTGSPAPEIRGSPIIAELPGIYLTERGKVCGYRLGLTPLGPIFQGGCDLANVGAKLQRIVRTQVEKQSAF